MSTNNKIYLLETIRANDENLLDQVNALLQAGADPSERTEYFETPLRLSSRKGRFDVVKLLFESGADPTHLNWTQLFHAIAYGNLLETKNCIEDGADLNARDTWERTPFLLAIQSGDIDKVQCLIDSGANISDAGRCNKPALEYAIEMDNAEMLRFLIQKGCDFEKYNDFGYTPLIQAAADNAINCVKELVRQGANIHKTDRAQFSRETAIGHASNLEIVEILVESGAEFSDIHDSARAKLLNLRRLDKLSTDKTTYLNQRYRTFGESNPQKCEFEFWYDMVRCGHGAWTARKEFKDEDSNDSVWCYQRFGKSITSLGDSEFVEIAGEYEDENDPDFCIYNEVFHHKANGELTIYQYPKDVFPPTDFHTATLAGGYIYIIGNLGYRGERLYGTTPLYRLNIQTFQIEKVIASGDCPGWIYDHSAILKKPSTIRIHGGEIVEKNGEVDEHRINKYDFELDLNTLNWTRHDQTSPTGITPCFPEEYKRFWESNTTILAIESENKWRLLKIISVHRVDVIRGDEIQFEHETVTASSEDFLFAVAYSTSELFENYGLLENAVSKKTWSFANVCQVCRTTVFPAYSRYIGFGEITEEERDAFEYWKSLFEQGKAKIE